MDNKHFKYSDNEPTSINLPKLKGYKEEFKKASKTKKAIIFIAPILVAALLSTGIIITFGYIAKNNATKKKDDNNIVDNANENSKKITGVCHLEGEHIHLTDLDLEEQHKYNISVFVGSVNLYTNSKIKAIVFNGEEYDYQEVVSYLTDYKKMASFIASNTSFYNAQKIKNGKYQSYIKNNITASDVSNFQAFISNKTDTYNRVKYYVIADDIIDFESESQTAKRYIEVSWAFPKKALTEHNKGLYYTADTSYYGKSHISNDYISFSVDGLKNNVNYNEKFGFILDDGRFVHMIDTYDGEWVLKKNIVIDNYKVEWED